MHPSIRVSTHLSSSPCPSTLPVLQPARKASGVATLANYNDDDDDDDNDDDNDEAAMKAYRLREFPTQYSVVFVRSFIHRGLWGLCALVRM